MSWFEKHKYLKWKFAILSSSVSEKFDTSCRRELEGSCKVGVF